jgi:Secretion system C-terminal sorting domain
MKMLGDSLRYYTNLQFQGRQQLDKEIENIRASLLLYRLNYAALIQQMRSANNPVLARAGLYNNLVTNATELPEIIEAILNEAEIAYETGRRTSIINFFGQLLPIAQQCPSSGGEAVFRARNIIQKVNDSLIYDDAGVCAQLGIYRKKQKLINQAAISSFVLIPNPAQHQTQLIFNQPPNSKYIIQIINGEGKVIENKMVNNHLSSLILNTELLSNGLYTVNIIRQNGEFESEKLLIIK